ncbi:MAG: M24 family metallopeptidase, partial [Stenotrophomonas maltophilia]
MNQLRVFQDAQEFLTREQLPGWLIHDYRDSNPIFRQVVTPLGHVTRPCLLYIPARGIPTLLVHHVDAGKFAPRNGEPESTPKIKLAIYRNRQTMVESLRQVLSGATRVAMEYSPNNELPRVSRVDAGTVELVRSLGPEVVSSADLMQFATQRWTSEQLAGHQRAAEKLGQIVNQAFQNIGQPGIERPGRELPRPGRDLPTEFEIAEFIRRRFAEEGLEAADGPIVSVNAHCSDPHYEPMPEGSSVIQPGDWVLIDLWAKENRPNSVYADITWVAYVGDQVPERHQAIFD